jgi:hypothetical protein
LCHADNLAALDKYVGCLELRTVFVGDLGVAVKAFHAAMMSGMISACASL